MPTEIAKIEKLKYRAIIKYLDLKELRGKQIYKGVVSSLGEQYPSYVTMKTWIAGFKGGKFSFAKFNLVFI